VRAYGPITDLEGEAREPIRDKSGREAVGEVPHGPISARKRQSSAGLTAAEDKLKATGGVQLGRVQQRGKFKILQLLLYLLLIFTNVRGISDKEYEESPHFLSTYDWRAPSAMRRLVLPARCMMPAPAEGTSAGSLLLSGSIVQEERVRTTPGAVCSASKSQFRGYCGAYSHWKFQDVPEVEVMFSVSSEECERAYITKKYLAPDGKELEVELNSELVYSFIEDGSITVESSNTYCTGIPVRIHNAQVAMRLEPLIESEVAQV